MDMEPENLAFMLLAIQFPIVLAYQIISKIILKEKFHFNVLITALSFIGLLISPIFVPSFHRARGTGQLTSCKSNLKNLGTALEIYAADNGGSFPPLLDRLVTTGVMKAMPTCAAAGSDTYSASYAFYNDPADSKRSNFTIYCRGENHKKRVRIPPDYPQYSLTGGLIEKP